MIVLGISSAADILGVALVDDSVILAEYSSAGGLKTEELVKYIDFVLGAAKKSTKDLGAVAVTVGPGSYGGLRGGLATAKALSQSLNIPLIGIPTLDAVSYNLECVPGLAFIALPARADEYNAALFGSDHNTVRRLTEDFVARGDLLAASLAKVKGSVNLVSPKDEIFLKIKKINPATQINQADPRVSIPRAGVVARAGALKASEGLFSDTLSITPHYSYKPNIREFKQTL